MTATWRWTGYAWSIAAALACTLAGFAMQPRFDIVNIAMVYVLPVVVIALCYERGAAIFTAVACVLAFDVAFVPPRGALTVDDAQYLFTFAILLIVALVISRLVASGRKRARDHAVLEIAAETERVRNTLLASISHDLRAPLAVVAGASSSLAENGDRLAADERRALAATIHDEVRDLSERLSKLLEMTRLEATEMRLDSDWAAFGEIAAAVVRRFAFRLATHRLIVEVPGDLPLLRVDAALVEQALGNLLDNAARHTPPGTVVRLRARVTGAELEVSVEDYGTRGDDTDVERVFLKFQHGNFERSAGGIGLGLAICRAIVHLHGGRAWAERVPGGGLAFRFTLPIESAPAAPSEGDGDEHERAASGDTGR